MGVLLLLQIVTKFLKIVTLIRGFQLFCNLLVKRSIQINNKNIPLRVYFYDNLQILYLLGYNYFKILKQINSYNGNTTPITSS